MQSRDSYRSKLQQLIASLVAWSGFVADVARVETGPVGNGWRIALTPHAAAACPVEIVLDGHEPRCDARIGNQTIENWLLPSLDLVLPLLEAVVEGRVRLERTSSAATGMLVSEVMHVHLGDGGVVALPPDEPQERRLEAPVETRAVHYLPYRKPPLRG